MTDTVVHIPALETDRLILRAPRLEDFEPRAAFYASDRSIWEDGPMDRAAAWRVWASEVGQWTLMGYGPFAVEDRATGAYLGEVGIYEPSAYPAPELGWFVVPEAEGRGIAGEAARAVMAWARDPLGWTRLVNYIDAGNARSIALALRLGGVRDDSLPGSGPGDVVIRHDLEALA
ncbi:N-acetyltransferase [Maritimibacter sp. 55A14]|uniref:GNAT family N-acetyltransferase n=1 Tax=Maritimibacter sp. 55A14 TaxID=2174844 RepID=UPI000D61F100|nr:GNAT family N-acetyltransferase [Maritimibacter sp. 55A14]PWE32229.1 N-acetyltransferase [Maritimibacter sp. 55A14]